MMTLVQLKYLIALDKWRNFAKAAEACYVTQPTLSMQIKKLEESLGVLLFDRSVKPLRPTAMGRRIIEQTRVVLREVEHLQELILPKGEGEVSGSLRVGIIPTLSPYLLPLFLPVFLKRHQNVELIVEELITDEIVGKVVKDELDVGLLVTPLGNRNVKEWPLFYELFLAYVSESHALSKKRKLTQGDLAAVGMWLLEEGHCLRVQALNICSENPDKAMGHFRFQTGNLETLKRLVDQQGGYTLLPELATMDFDDKEYARIRYFKNPQPVREVSMIVHRHHLPKRPLLEAMRQHILLSVPAIMLNPQRGQIVTVAPTAEG